DRQLAVHRLAREAVERHQVLHRALAEGGLADDQPAVIVLDRAGEDLGRGGAQPVDQHRERTGVGGAGLPPPQDPGVGPAVARPPLSRSCTTGPWSMNSPVSAVASGRYPPPSLRRSSTRPSMFSALSSLTSLSTSRVVERASLSPRFSAGTSS